MRTHPTHLACLRHVLVVIKLFSGVRGRAPAKNSFGASQIACG